MKQLYSQSFFSRLFSCEWIKQDLGEMEKKDRMMKEEKSGKARAYKRTSDREKSKMASKE